MTRRSEYLEQLAQVPLFSACNKTELKNLAKRTNEIKVDAGQVIIREQQGAEIIVLTQWDFEQALDEAPRMTRKLLAGMARRLRNLDERK